jgi:hypothetical protein
MCYPGTGADHPETLHANGEGKDALVSDQNLLAIASQFVDLFRNLLGRV